MADALKNLVSALPSLHDQNAADLAQTAAEFLQEMRPVQYSCLGCEHCYPAVAQNAIALAFPAFEQGADLSCDFRLRDEAWPPVIGEYFILDKAGTVAVSTLASTQLAEELVQREPSGLAITGKTETENIGIDKVIKNIVSSPTLRYLILAGTDPKGHLPGQTFLALAKNGVDENGRVIDSPGKRSILRNVSSVEVNAFRDQVQVIDMIGCESVEEISARIEELAQQATASCTCSECGGQSPVTITNAPKVLAREPNETVTMDKAGYFVILPLSDQKVISVEHYSYDNTLLRIIEGTNARAIYQAIVKEGWVTELSHAAYLGKELAKAELSLQHGFKYMQDGA
jgi:tetrahydromethanopterin S-methyltransferase subunit A